MHIIKRGAEAVLYLEERDGQKVLVKDRVKKSYRIPELDTSIRSFRTKRENNLMLAAQRSGVDTPRIFSLEKTRLIMEYLDGPTVKDCLNDLPESERKRVYKLIGESLAGLHRNGMVHGDLTTSNMILSPFTGADASSKVYSLPQNVKLYVIDFGLGKTSNRAEDQAVDLYLLREAILSTHFKYMDEAWKNIINAYRKNYSSSAVAIKRFERVESRRRYKGH